MNRREFFSAASAITLTTGLLPTISAFGASGDVAEVQSSTRSVRFRAKRMFLDSWTSDSLLAASFVQDRLSTIRRDGCNGLIVIPGRCSGTEWMERVAAEASRLELTVLVPTQLTRDFLDKAQTVIPLAQEEGFLHCCDEKAASDGGFILLNSENDVFGLVLYDVSRCHWAGYASSDVGVIQNVEPCGQNSKLTAARWLDLTRQSFTS